MVNDGQVVLAVTCANNNVRCEIVHRQRGNDHGISEKDCVYDCWNETNEGSTYNLTMFSDENGQPNPYQRGPIVLDAYSRNEWHTFIKEVSIS